MTTVNNDLNGQYMEWLDTEREEGEKKPQKTKGHFALKQNFIFLPKSLWQMKNAYIQF